MDQASGRVDIREMDSNDEMEDENLDRAVLENSKSNDTQLLGTAPKANVESTAILDAILDKELQPKLVKLQTDFLSTNMIKLPESVYAKPQPESTLPVVQIALVAGIVILMAIALKDPSPLTIALAASILLFLLIGFHINNSIAKSNLEAHKEIVQSAENVNKTFIQGAEKVTKGAKKAEQIRLNAAKEIEKVRGSMVEIHHQAGTDIHKIQADKETKIHKISEESKVKQSKIHEDAKIQQESEETQRRIAKEKTIEEIEKEKARLTHEAKASKENFDFLKNKQHSDNEKELKKLKIENEGKATELEGFLEMERIQADKAKTTGEQERLSKKEEIEAQKARQRQQAKLEELKIKNKGWFSYFKAGTT